MPAKRSFEQWLHSLFMAIVVAICAFAFVSQPVVETASESTLLSSPCDEKSSSLSTLMGLNGNVSECSCSFTEIEDANIATVLPLLKKVVNSPFFSHFRIDLCSSCDLWHDSPRCMMKECSVCECHKPPSWAAEVESMPQTGPDCGHIENQVVTAIDSKIKDGWLPLLDGPLERIDNIEYQDSKDTVVDLRANPERYTGYSGPSAAKVWSAIHSSNCFQHAKGFDPIPKEGDAMYCLLPVEQRLYNRLISGLHSSISLHIAHSYCHELDPNNIGECNHWAPNMAIANERVLNYPDRVENLYVAFAILLRAVVKAGPAVTAAVPSEDPVFGDSLSNWKDYLLPELTRMADDCPNTFDESTLQTHPEFLSKRSELQRRFQHLQKIIQCVGCDRCKLWGTVQTLGIGTALRILFGDNAGSIHLSRQEAVALVHTLERFSSSLVFAREFRNREFRSR